MKGNFGIVRVRFLCLFLTGEFIIICHPWTVNTAARMESNGKKEAIHASQETADIIFGHGKGHWVHPRGEKIVRKNLNV